MSLLRRTPFHRVLWRAQLLWGGERELVLFTTVVAIALPFNGMNFPALFVGILFWICVMPALRYMGKIDPQFSQVYRRHIEYKRYYPARSRPYRTT